MTDFNTLLRLYNKDQFAELLHNPDGLYWLKLRSLSCTKQLQELCRRTGINFQGISNNQLLAHVYNSRPPEHDLDKFIREIYESERRVRRENEDYLISQLYQMRDFDWGGLYQNSLERTIIDNYVKKIQSWDRLNLAIENELHRSMRSYVQCSWYNHWSSIIIEDIFKDHPAILPAVGLVKKIDFFIHNFPFDLKVTYFPDGYMKALRQKEGLPSESTVSKKFCRYEKIKFDTNKPEGLLFHELLTRIIEYPSKAARDFMMNFRATRMRLIRQTMNAPQNLIRWLYENQGARRFDAASRFFLILADAENIEESWKLKRNKKLLTDSINKHLDQMQSKTIDNLRIEFKWENEIYETYADALFVVLHLNG